MKKVKILKSVSMLVLALGIVSLTTSCSKYRAYDDGEVINNTYSGTMLVTRSGSHPAADFEGDRNSGEYSFAWQNISKTASANFDITSPSGAVQMIILDKKGREVLNETILGGSSRDSFSGISSEGKAGKWKVIVKLTDFEGEGSFSINP